MNLARELIKNMKPYRPPLTGRTEFKGLLLDFNERSSAPKRGLESLINRYPEYGKLEQAVADYCGVNKDQILLNNGSDQAIDVVFRTFIDPGDNVIIPSPTFGMIEQAAELAGASIATPLYLKPDLTFSFDEVLAKSAKLIVVCNPNSPTGTLVKAADIEKIAAASPSAIIMVDEAYFEFSRVTAIPLIQKYPNIVVTRTFSKAFGLAGLRLGYAIGSAEHIAEMRKVCGPYAVSSVAQAAGLAVLKDRRAMTVYVREVMNEAKPFVEQFFTTNHIRFYDSSANFILFQPSNWKVILDDLAKNRILVRAQDRPGTPGCLRLTIGTIKEMERFIEAYQKILEEQP
jgi:histidinol-phosphate aminotransferase